MCIRDRPGNAPQANVVLAAAVVQIADDGEAQVGSGQQGADETAPRLAHADDCLLYTSDAADERSSVDLGGRRIIKKKKKQETHTRHE